MLSLSLKTSDSLVISRKKTGKNKQTHKYIKFLVIQSQAANYWVLFFRDESKINFKNKKNKVKQNQKQASKQSEISLTMFRCVCVRTAAKAAETVAGSRLLPCASPMQGLLQFAGVLSYTTSVLHIP